MLDWLKDKVQGGIGAVQQAALISALTKQFAPIEETKSGLAGIAGRPAGSSHQQDEQLLCVYSLRSL
jgi:hypothetical protein